MATNFEASYGIRPSKVTYDRKHTIHGDGNITDDAESIRNLMNMNYDIKR